MDTRELMVTNYFVNTLKLFYNECEDFKKAIDSGLDDDWVYHGYFKVGDTICEFRSGSARVCMVFEDGSKNELFDRYVVKVGRDLLTDNYCKENERQNRNEYLNYCELKNKKIAEFFTETIEGPLYKDVFNVETTLDSHIYISERADTDSDRFWTILHEHIESHLSNYADSLWDYLDGTDYEYLEDVDEWDMSEAISCYLEDIGNEEQYLMICRILQMDVTDEIENIVFNIGDCHDANIGFIDDRAVMVDYAWHRTDGQHE